MAATRASRVSFARLLPLLALAPLATRPATTVSLSPATCDAPVVSADSAPARWACGGAHSTASGPGSGTITAAAPEQRRQAWLKRSTALSGARVRRHGNARPAAQAGVPLLRARNEMLGLINAERVRAGYAPLRFDRTLNVIAQARSWDMISRHYFSHDIPGGGTFVTILDRDHVRYEMAGENIARNNYIGFYPLARAVAQTNADLMHSPEHRANILDSGYTEIGLGVAMAPRGNVLVMTEVFVRP